MHMPLQTSAAKTARARNCCCQQLTTHNDAQVEALEGGCTQAAAVCSITQVQRGNRRHQEARGPAGGKLGMGKPGSCLIPCGTCNYNNHTCMVTTRPIPAQQATPKAVQLGAEKAGRRQYSCSTHHVERSSTEDGRSWKPPAVEASKKSEGPPGITQSRAVAR